MKLRYLPQVLKLAWQIYRHLPPRDGAWHAISYNINLRKGK